MLSDKELDTLLDESLEEILLEGESLPPEFMARRNGRRWCGSIKRGYKKRKYYKVEIYKSTYAGRQAVKVWVRQVLCLLFKVGLAKL